MGGGLHTWHILGLVVYAFAVMHFFDFDLLLFKLFVLAVCVFPGHLPRDF